MTAPIEEIETLLELHKASEPPLQKVLESFIFRVALDLKVKNLAGDKEIKDNEQLKRIMLLETSLAVSSYLKKDLYKES